MRRLTREELLGIAARMLRDLEPADTYSQAKSTLKNRSSILALPNQAKTIRGYSPEFVAQFCGGPDGLCGGLELGSHLYFGPASTKRRASKSGHGSPRAVANTWAKYDSCG